RPDHPTGAGQMQRPQVPGSVTLGRVLLIVESGLWLLGARAVAAIGVWFLSAGKEEVVNRLQQVGYTGANVSASGAVIGGTGLACAVVIFVIAVIGIWSGATMGRLTAGPRVTGIVLASLGLLIGIVAALDRSRATVNTAAGTFRDTPLPGIIIAVVNLLIIWALGFSGKTRAAFRSLPPPPPGYAAMAPAGYGPPPAYGQPAASDAYPPPPPPPPPRAVAGEIPDVWTDDSRLGDRRPGTADHRGRALAPGRSRRGDRRHRGHGPGEQPPLHHQRP